MLGALLSLASAAFFGLNNVAVRRGVLTASVLQGMAITVPLGLPVFFLFMPLLGGWTELFGFSSEALFWLSAAGVIHFVIGRYGNYRAIHALGATLSTPVQQLSVLISLVLGLVWLDEAFTGVKAFGLFLVLVGPALVLGRREAGRKAATTKVFTPQYGSGFLWGAVCAVGYGVSPLFIVWGMAEAPGMGAAVAGVVVSYLAAALVVLVIVGFSGGMPWLRGMDRGAARSFVWSGLFVALSQLLRYMALAVAPVSVVAPIQRLSVMFRLIFGAMFNRDAEILDSSVIFGIVLSVVGSIVLALDTATAIDWAGSLPQQVPAFFVEWNFGR